MTKSSPSCSHPNCRVKFTEYKSQRKCAECKNTFCDAHLRARNWFGHIPFFAEQVSLDILCLGCLEHAKNLPHEYIRSVKLQECGTENCHAIASPISKLKPCKNCGNLHCKKHTVSNTTMEKMDTRENLPYPQAEHVCTACEPDTLIAKPSLFSRLKVKFSRKSS